MNPERKTYSKSRGKTASIVISVAMIVLLSGALWLSIYLERRTGEIAAQQFNQQQLLLARYAALQLEQNFELICDELRVLNYSPSVQYIESVSWAGRMGITMSVLKQTGVLCISRIDPAGNRAYSVDNRGKPSVLTTKGQCRLSDMLGTASLPANKGRILVSEIWRDKGRYPGKLLLTVSIPSYQDSIDDAHPVATGRFVGTTEVILDINSFVGKKIADIRSGKTGYAWVIDQQGTFLYHRAPDFVGENAFAVRAKKQPRVSFSRINSIQKDYMLSGQEGTSWYISGSFQGDGITLEKLIAYAPVHIASTATHKFWSCAVVAPIGEVEEVIKRDIRHIHILHGVIVLVIILVGLAGFSYERRWEKKLGEEVEEKTHSLRRSEERYRSLVENAQDVIYSLDRDGNILSMNSYGANILSNGSSNPSHESYEGRNFLELAAWGELSEWTIHEAFDTGEPEILEHTAAIAERQYWFNTHLIPIKGGSGEVRALLGISRNVTEQKEMLSQMANTEKLASLGLLAAGVAHEINNPIAIIMGFADMLLEKCEPGDDMHDMLKRIVNQSQVCEKVVSQLLSFSRVQENAEDVTDVNKEIEGIAYVASNTLMMKRIKIDLALEPDLPKVKADPKQIQQVFLNLVNNAIGAMRTGGRLTISTTFSSASNMVQVCFFDTGSGIPIEHRAKIFDPFFTTKKTGEGTGLGLTVSYNIITNYGGTINFASATQEEAADQKGTTFTVALPAFVCQLKPNNAEGRKHGGKNTDCG